MVVIAQIYGLHLNFLEVCGKLYQLIASIELYLTKVDIFRMALKEVSARIRVLSGSQSVFRTRTMQVVLAWSWYVNSTDVLSIFDEQRAADLVLVVDFSLS